MLCAGFRKSEQFYGTLTYFNGVTPPSLYRTTCCSTPAIAIAWRPSISLHPDRVTRHHFVDPHSDKFHHRAWTPPCPSLPPQTPIFLGIHIYRHIFTHISEFLCISLHTGVPQSFIKVCSCWPPCNQKLSNVNTKEVSQGILLQQKMNIISICNMG